MGCHKMVQVKSIFLSYCSLGGKVNFLRSLAVNFCLWLTEYQELNANHKQPTSDGALVYKQSQCVSFGSDIKHQPSWHLTLSHKLSYYYDATAQTSALPTFSAGSTSASAWPKVKRHEEKLDSHQVKSKHQTRITHALTTLTLSILNEK